MQLNMFYAGVCNLTPHHSESMSNRVDSLLSLQYVYLWQLFIHAEQSFRASITKTYRHEYIYQCQGISLMLMVSLSSARR